MIRFAAACALFPGAFAAYVLSDSFLYKSTNVDAIASLIPGEERKTPAKQK